MKQKYSPIMQMLLGNRGSHETMTFSDEYRKVLSILVDKQNEFKDKIKDNPQLLKAFDEFMEAAWDENALHADESYREGFSFGLAIGQEVFDN